MSNTKKIANTKVLLAWDLRFLIYLVLAICYLVLSF
jgi:hypothetical protein